MVDDNWKANRQPPARDMRAAPKAAGQAGKEPIRAVGTDDLIRWVGQAGPGEGRARPATPRVEVRPGERPHGACSMVSTGSPPCWG
jgi:hypothetical protein